MEQALCKEVEKLQKEKVDEHELQKVKNQEAAANFRRLQSDFSLMFQLLIGEGNRGWRSINTDPPRLQAVTTGDIQRVAKKYFQPEGRNVLIFYTKKKAESQGGAR